MEATVGHTHFHTSNDIHSKNLELFYFTSGLHFPKQVALRKKTVKMRTYVYNNITK